MQKKSNSPANPYQDFTSRLKLLVSKHKMLLTTTLSNIFTMRLIGNKTHGDLAEIAISEFINQYMYDFKSIHVGKDLFRAKSKEEDIKIINEITKEEFPVSLKAYGNGPLQLSTDKETKMFARLNKEKKDITDKKTIDEILNGNAFSDFQNINILPLIYDENEKQCNILVFDYSKAKKETVKILKMSEGKGRLHPVFRFFNLKDEYICEVRYGGTDANALQRGLWTHTKNGIKYFESITNGWIEYSHNLILVKLFSHALVSSEIGHKDALEKIKNDIIRLKKQSGLLV